MDHINIQLFKGQEEEEKLYERVHTVGLISLSCNLVILDNEKDQM